MSFDLDAPFNPSFLRNLGIRRKIIGVDYSKHHIQVPRQTAKIKVKKIQPKVQTAKMKVKKIQAKVQVKQVESKKLSSLAVQDYEKNFNVVSWMQQVDNNLIKRINTNVQYPFCIGMMNVNGGLNIGMMVRQAVIYGCQEVFLFGRKRFDHRGTVGAENYIKITHIKSDSKDTDPIDCKTFLQTMEQNKLIPVFVEQGGILTHQVPWTVIAANSKKKLARYCFIFGNEGHGISGDILALSRQIPGSFILSLPQHGVLRSLNVAMACSIVLHEFYSRVVFDQTIGKFTDP